MRKKPNTKRRGASMIEGAIVLSVQLLFIFGCMDIGLLVLRHNAVAEAACRGARAAVVRGEHADDISPLGAEPMQFSAAVDNPIAAACRAVLPTMSPSDVTVDVEWPEGTNDMDSPVAVTVHTTHKFFVPFIDHLADVEIRSTSTMAIAK